MSKALDYLSKDYEAFRTDMINQIPRLFPEWTDYGSSDMGVVLLELLAHGLDILSYYQDRISSEGYLHTATQRSSVIDICEPLGYRLSEPTPSRVGLVFEVVPSTTTALTIPVGFQVSTVSSEREEPIIFEIDNQLVIPAGNNGLEKDVSDNYIYSVNATQGITIGNNIVGSSAGTPSQRFKLTYPNVIDGTLLLYINEGNGFQLWTDVSKLLVQDTATKQHYWRSVDADGYTWVSFGNGGDGKIPVEGLNNIQATYRVGGGTVTNVGAMTVTRTISNLSRIKSVFNPLSAIGGTDRESIESVRVNFPKFLRTNNRAVTKGDYETLARRVSGVLKAHAEPNPLISNGIQVYIKIKDNVDNNIVKTAVFDYLDGLKTITTQLNIEDAVNSYLDIVVNVNYYGDQETVRNGVIDTVNEIMAKENREFGQGEQMFRVYSALGLLQGLTGLDITKFTIIPRVLGGQTSGNAVFSNVTVNQANTLRGTWRVLMTSSSAFSVQFDTSGEFSGGQVLKGTGSLGSPFTSNGSEVSFLITTGGLPMATNDFWLFKTTPYRGDVIIEGREFLALGNLTIGMTGGI